MRTVKRDIVAAVIFSSDNYVLLGKKDPNVKMYFDAWGIPGGGVEEGETRERALQREIYEETGIDINGQSVELIEDTNSDIVEKVLPSGETVLCDMKFFTYVVKLDKNANEVKVVTTDDLIECKWILKDQLQDVKLNKPTIWLFKKMGLLQ